MRYKNFISTGSGGNDEPLVRLSLGAKIFTLFAAMFVMLISIGLLRGVLPSGLGDSRGGILLFSALQDLLMFMLPAWLVARIVSRRPMSYLGVSEKMAGRQFAGVLIFLIIISPLFNAIIDWNAGIHFPESWQQLEIRFRQWEDSAAQTTQLLLGDSSATGLISGVLVVGLLTGFAEEAFFRAGLQKAMTSSGVNVHISVWIAALVFSAMHLQFFGFVPRLLLGAIFGYIYLYTGSLWVAATAHALNNSWVVIAGWLYSNGIISTDLSQSDAYPDSIWLIVFSAFLTIIFIIKLWKPLFAKVRQPALKSDLNTEYNGKE